MQVSLVLLYEWLFHMKIQDALFLCKHEEVFKPVYHLYILIFMHQPISSVSSTYNYFNILPLQYLMLMAFPSWNYILRAFANMDIRNFYMSYKQNVEVYQYGEFDLWIANIFRILFSNPQQHCDSYCTLDRNFVTRTI